MLLFIVINKFISIIILTYSYDFNSYICMLRYIFTYSYRFTQMLACMLTPIYTSASSLPHSVYSCHQLVSKFIARSN